MNIAQEILASADRNGPRTAVIDEGGAWTYDDIVAKARRIGGILRRRSRGRAVGIILPTCKEYYPVYLGTLLAGKVPVPVNFLLQPEEIRFILQDAGADTLVTSTFFEELVPGDTVRPLYLDALGAADKLAALVNPAGVPDTGADETGTILYTSGTTGKPKGVVLTHGNLLWNSRQAARVAGLDGRCTCLGVLPMFHSFALCATVLIPLLHGGTIVAHKRFHPRQVLESVAEHAVHVLLAVPSMYRLLLKAQAADPVDLSSVRIAIAGGEPLPEDLARSFESAVGLPLLEGYGLTETSPVISLNSPGDNRPGTAGRPLPGVETRVVDLQTQSDLPAGTPGELWVRGPMVMQGYHGRERETAEVLTEDGWLRTGDICVQDPEGYLSIRGREKDLIIIAGENVSPAEIEDALSLHAAIFEVAVLGEPDPARGEVPVAYVVLHEGRDASARDLLAHCRGRLAAHKVPRRIVFREELPHGPTGKILKRAIDREPVLGAEAGRQA